MSARIPFFSSNTRQESLADDDKPGSVDDQFSADKSNDQDALMDASTKERSNDGTDYKLPSELDTHVKPLNVNGLIRNRTRPRPPQRTLLSGGNIPRPGTADPNFEDQPFAVHTTTIAAPTPFKASRTVLPPLLSASGTSISRSVTPLNFKAPAPPSMHQNGDMLSSNAHIPTSSDNLYGGDTTTAFPSGRNGPGRILKVNNDGSSLDSKSQRFSAQQYMHGKRKENEIDKTDQPDQSQKHLKRFRSENSLLRTGERSQGGLSLSASCGASSASEYEWNHPTHDASEAHRCVVDNEEDSHLKYQQTEVEMTNVQEGSDEHGGALDRILGRDVNAYVEEHLLEKYERACNRWRTCSLEEWAAGAEEIKAKYLKIFDFVKDHVNAKVDLYTSLGKKIEQHENILAEREEMLSGARARMVKESEGVLGKSLGM